MTPNIVSILLQQIELDIDAQLMDEINKKLTDSALEFLALGMYDEYVELLTNLAFYYLGNGNLQYFITLYERCEEQYMQHPSQMIECCTVNLKAYVELINQQYDQAQSLVFQAIRTSKSINNNRLLKQAFIAQGQIYLALEEEAMALKSMKIAVFYAIKINSPAKYHINYTYFHHLNCLIQLNALHQAKTLWNYMHTIIAKTADPILKLKLAYYKTQIDYLLLPSDEEVRQLKEHVQVAVNLKDFITFQSIIRFVKNYLPKNHAVHSYFDQFVEEMKQIEVVVVESVLTDHHSLNRQKRIQLLNELNIQTQNNYWEKLEREISSTNCRYIALIAIHYTEGEAVFNSSNYKEKQIAVRNIYDVNNRIFVNCVQGYPLPNQYSIAVFFDHISSLESQIEQCVQLSEEIELLTVERTIKTQVFLGYSIIETENATITKCQQAYNEADGALYYAIQSNKKYIMYTKKNKIPSN
jgi:hypothetical protein